MQLPNDECKRERGGAGEAGGGGGGGGEEEEAVVVLETHPSQQQQQHQQQQPVMATRHECFSCKRPITDRFLLKAVDRFWHEDCLRCSCCDCRLGEVGSTLFTKADLLLCRRDYLRLFGATGYCSACAKLIPAFEMVMRARDNVYHLECFACQQCNHRFCVGDRYYLLNNQIFCEFDYEERLAYTGSHHHNHHHHHHHHHSQHPHQPAYGCDPAVSAAGTKHAQHQLQAANQGLLTDDGSSGYGSPSPTSV